MFEDEIQRKIADLREIGLPRYIPREGRIHLAELMVSTIIGARRSGKSFRALQAADELREQGFIPSIERICHVDFDNPILSTMTARDLGRIQATFLKLTPECDIRSPAVFILDEIHKISGWEEYVIDLSRNPQWKVIVTGSSSKLLRDDVATELRGKALSSIVYPLAFTEFLRFKDYRGNGASTSGAAETMRLFDEYLKWGGYPAIANIEEHSKEALLHEYFDTMILRDVIQRYNVSKPQQCIHLYRYLISNMAKPHTLNSAYSYLRESGFATSRDSIRDYLRWAEDSWFLFTVPIYSHSHKEQERNYKKVYCIDWALALRNSLVWDGSFSRAFENMLYLHLRRNYSRVNYYLTRSKRQEVDFIAQDEHGKAVLAAQVCLNVSEPDTMRRELSPLLSTAKHFGIKENLIITQSEERTINEQGVTVHVIPAWKYMLAKTTG